MFSAWRSACGGLNVALVLPYRLAQLFTKPNFYEPLLAGEDPLAGLHANTHLAQVDLAHTQPPTIWLLSAPAITTVWTCLSGNMLLGTTLELELPSTSVPSLF